MIRLDEVRRRAEADAKTYGYHLNPDNQFLMNLLEGIGDNWERYGYPSCPCRLASGKFELDRDILCPCDYRDPDVEEFGACYCALYVRRDVVESKTNIQPIPERRPVEKQARAYGTLVQLVESPEATVQVSTSESANVHLRMWYCRQCGYVVFREDPPYVCPICRAKRELFSLVYG